MQGEFGRLLRKYRKAAGKTLGDLARLLDFQPSYVSDVELGRRAPFQFDRLRQIAEFLSPHADLEALDRAAAVDRGAFELPVEGTTDRARQVGAMLMRGWRNLSDEDLEVIGKMVKSKEAEVK